MAANRGLCSPHQGSLRQLTTAAWRAASAWAIFTGSSLAAMKGYNSLSPPSCLGWTFQREHLHLNPKPGTEYLRSQDFKRLTSGSLPNNNSRTQLKKSLKPAIATVPCSQGKLSGLYTRFTIQTWELFYINTWHHSTRYCKKLSEIALNLYTFIFIVRILSETGP